MSYDYFLLHKPTTNIRVQNDTVQLIHLQSHSEQFTKELQDCYQRGIVYASYLVDNRFSQLFFEDLQNYLFLLDYRFTYNGIICTSESSLQLLCKSIEQFVRDKQFYTDTDRQLLSNARADITTKFVVKHKPARPLPQECIPRENVKADMDALEKAQLSLNYVHKL